MPMTWSGERSFAAGGTMPSYGCRCRYVQLERVHLPGHVTGNGDRGIESDGYCSRVGYPTDLLPVARRFPHPHRAVGDAADRGLPVRADRHRVDMVGVAGECLP